MNGTGIAEPRPADAARRLLQDEVREHAVSAETRRAWDIYEAWSVHNGQPLLPVGNAAGSAAIDGETLLLRFVHANRQDRNWSGTQVKKAGGYVARKFVAEGFPDPRGRRWARYVLAATQHKGPQARIDPMSGSQVMALPEAVMRSRDDHSSLQIAATAAIVDLLGLPSGNLTSLASGAVALRGVGVIERRGSAVIVRHGSARAVIDPTRAPVHHEVLSRLLGSVMPDTDPLRSLSTSPSSNIRRVKQAWLKCQVAQDLQNEDGCASAPVPSISVVRQWWEVARPEQRTWLIRFLAHPSLLSDTRDLAWFFTALCFGGRASEVNHLQFKHLRATDKTDGYTFVIPSDEHKGGRIAKSMGAVGRDLVIVVPHADVVGPSAGDECNDRGTCPACLLSAYLEVRAFMFGDDAHGRIFLGATGQPMSAKQGHELVNRLWAGVTRGDEAEYVRHRIGGRTVRMTTATLMRATGCTVGQIAELLHHSKLSTAVGYVHSQDAVRPQRLVLPWAVPEERDHPAR